MKDLLEKAKNNYFNEIENEKTFKMFNEVLEKTGDNEAKFYLGEMYYFGIGTEQNLKKAFEYMKELAENDWQDAYFWLGNMYFQGEGTDTNDKEAIKYLLKAIAVDNVNTMKAEYILGMIYFEGKENGIDVAKNKGFGLELIKKSAEKGYEDGKRRLEEINRLLNNKNRNIQQYEVNQRKQSHGQSRYTYK